MIQVLKMRGTDHSRDEHPFSIDPHGLGVYAPRVTIRRDVQEDLKLTNKKPQRAKLGIPQLDSLLGDGIPYGSSVLVSGVAGTGKTLLSLEFIYKGAEQFGEKGIFVSFEETEDRLRANASSMGWDLDKEINQGRIEILFIPQTDILVEKHLLLIHERIKRLGAKRIAIDSFSLFVHKIKDRQVAREKLFQLATLVQMSQAIGFLSTDIPYGSNSISRFGIEETVVDEVILLSDIANGSERERYIEIYKLRNTAHSTGKFRMDIGRGGISVRVSKTRKKNGK